MTYNSYVKFHGKKIIGSHNMAMLYPNLCYNKVCDIKELHSICTLYNEIMFMTSCIHVRAFVHVYNKTNKFDCAKCQDSDLHPPSMISLLYIY